MNKIVLDLETQLKILENQRGYDVRIFWDCEVEGRPLPRLRFNPDPSTVAFYDPFTDGKTNTIARILILFVQTLKDDEDTFLIIWNYADAIVLH